MTATLTFIGHEFTDSQGDKRTLSLTVNVEDGDFSGVIAAVRDEGGSIIPDPDGVSGGWFLPWPPAAIRIDTLP